MKTATKFAPGTSTVTDPSSGLTFNDEFDIFTIGAGYLNIPAALGNTSLFTGVALSPAATFNSATNTVQLEPSALSAVWGTGTVSGTSAIWGTGAAWGTSAIWGTGTPSATSAVWGTSAVWCTSAVWGTTLPGGEAAAVAINGDNK